MFTMTDGIMVGVSGVHHKKKRRKERKKERKGREGIEKKRRERRVIPHSLSYLMSCTHLYSTSEGEKRSYCNIYENILT